MLQIDVRESRELTAVVVALRAVEKNISSDIRKQTRQVLQPEWQKTAREHSQTRLEVRVLGDTARASVSSNGITLKSASVGKVLKGGFVTKAMYAGIEFGADRAVKNTYQARSSKGKTYSVTRRTRAQLRPRRRSGYVIYPAAAEFIPRAAAMWTQITVRVIAEAAEGKGN
jgi:hypothetical protein